MDGTFTVSSQSDRSPLSAGTVRCFHCVIVPHSSHFTEENEALILSSVLFPASPFDTDASDDLKSNIQRICQSIT